MLARAAVSPARLALLVALVTPGGLPTCGLPAPASAAERIRVVLDTDANNELDDQHAIAYLLFNQHVFEVEGITVNRTRAGGSLARHHAEAARVVEVCGQSGRFPLRRGASGSFEQIRGALDRPGFDGQDAVDLIIERARARDERRLVLLPVGKLTNVALALAKDPAIASRLRVVWLGSNYPEPGEYNQLNDEHAIAYILETAVPFEIVTVRYGRPSGTDAVRVSLDDVRRVMPGKGPRVAPPVEGRHGGWFESFGDYSVSLFENIDLHGDPPSRALFDMAAVAVVKNPAWARAVTLPAPLLAGGKWVERPGNPRRMVLWEHFDRAAILQDFLHSMASPRWGP